MRLKFVLMGLSIIEVGFLVSVNNNIMVYVEEGNVGGGLMIMDGWFSGVLC